MVSPTHRDYDEGIAWMESVEKMVISSVWFIVGYTGVTPWKIRMLNLNESHVFTRKIHEKPASRMMQGKFSSVSPGKKHTPSSRLCWWWTTGKIFLTLSWNKCCENFLGQIDIYPILPISIHHLFQNSKMDIPRLLWQQERPTYVKSCQKIGRFLWGIFETCQPHPAGLSRHLGQVRMMWRYPT